MDKFLLDYLRHFEAKIHGTEIEGLHHPIDKLVAVADSLDEVVVPLHLARLNKDGRDELRGKRIVDMNGVVYDTAEALSQEPVVAQNTGTSQETLVQLADQDMAIGSLYLQLQNIYNAADLGILGVYAAAKALLEKINEDAGRAMADATARGKRSTLESIFGNPLYAWKKAEAREASKDPDTAELEEKKAEEEIQSAVHELVADAHELRKVHSKDKKSKG